MGNLVLTPFDTFWYYEFMNEIQPHQVYTTQETQVILKVSRSTIKRLLKGGIIKANKIGGQYRILGKELLRLLSPKLERKMVSRYQTIKRNVKSKIKSW